MTVAETIRRKLTERFAPTRLEIDDESHRHVGHAGARPGGETHFAVTIVAAAFAGLSRVARQRLVYQILADELATRVHALSLTTLTPAEPGSPRQVPAGLTLRRPFLRVAAEVADQRLQLLDRGREPLAVGAAQHQRHAEIAAPEIGVGADLEIGDSAPAAPPDPWRSCLRRDGS